MYTGIWFSLVKNFINISYGLQTKAQTDHKPFKTKALQHRDSPCLQWNAVKLEKLNNLHIILNLDESSYIIRYDST